MNKYHLVGLSSSGGISGMSQSLQALEPPWHMAAEQRGDGFQSEPPPPTPHPPPPTPHPTPNKNDAQCSTIRCPGKN